MKPPPFSSLSSSTGKLKPVFLYVISIQTDGVNRPIFQVLSQRHTSDFIAYFMKYWRHVFNNEKNPHEVIMDNSSALILASVQAFTPYRTKLEYLNACFEKLFSKQKSSLECFLRLDRSHIVKQIDRTDVINKQDSRTKNLLRHILGYLITVEDVKIVEKVIFNLFVLILNKFEHCTEITEAKWELKSIADRKEIDGIIKDCLNNSDSDDEITDDCSDDVNDDKKRNKI